jgi:hypothetical protein
MPKEINHGNDSYNVDSSVECGKDKLFPSFERSGAKTRVKICIIPVFSGQILLSSLFFILFPHCDTLLVQPFFCSFIFRMQENLKKPSVRCCPTLPYSVLYFVCY